MNNKVKTVKKVNIILFAILSVLLCILLITIVGIKPDDSTNVLRKLNNEYTIIQNDVGYQYKVVYHNDSKIVCVINESGKLIEVDGPDGIPLIYRKK